MRCRFEIIIIAGIILGLFISACQSRRSDTSSIKRVVAARIGDKTVKQDYEIILPEDYKPGMKNPVLLVFHDKGEDGEKAIRKWENIAADTDYLLVCPTFPKNIQRVGGQENERLMSIVQDLKDRHNINIRNLYVVGYGEGARLAQVFSMNYPALVRGVVLISGDNFAPPNPLGNSVPFLIITGPGDRSMHGEALERRLASEDYHVQLIKLKGETNVLSSKSAKLAIEFFQKIPPLPPKVQVENPPEEKIPQEGTQSEGEK
ncbi:MAG: hypothetical protein J7M18_03505 [Candidatus Eremiobacteraeota bacterium]|nr:hypothetical protein [Candidatus Eremiobacteraeota bacterium]